MKLCPKTAATASGTEARETENAFPVADDWGRFFQSRCGPPVAPERAAPALFHRSRSRSAETEAGQGLFYFSLFLFSSFFFVFAPKVLKFVLVPYGSLSVFCGLQWVRYEVMKIGDSLTRVRREEDTWNSGESRCNSFLFFFVHLRRI